MTQKNEVLLVRKCDVDHCLSLLRIQIEQNTDNALLSSRISGRLDLLLDLGLIVPAVYKEYCLLGGF
ncbi:MAG: hypothetical protein HFG70_13215 [Hungatella sp.]|nr:hypothetical protein [Hungatella sp.]